MIKNYERHLIGFLKGGYKSRGGLHVLSWALIIFILYIAWNESITMYNSYGVTNIWLYLMLLFIVVVISCLNMVTIREGQIETEKAIKIEGMLHFLPIKKETVEKAYVKNRILSTVPIFMFMIGILLFGKSEGELLSLRGFLLLIIFCVLGVITLVNINGYTQKYWKTKKVERIQVKEAKYSSIKFFMFLLIINLFSISITDWVKGLEFPRFILDFFVFQFIGTKGVGLALVFISIILYYYFNYVYILKGIEGGSLRRWRR